jgi:membrane associated rhomboid family serine protease
MGIYDRDYYRQPQQSNPFGGMRFWSVNSWLIAINVAVFVLDLILGGPLYELGYFSVNTAIYHLEIWRFITLQFLHDENHLQHIGYNMLALFFFGPIAEQYLGSRRYLAFYLLCGIASGLSYVLLWATHILISDPNTRLIGASGSIFGVLIAAAFIAPDVRVLVDFFFPVKLRTQAWIMVAIAAFTVIRNGDNAGGEAAHLGGAAAGFLLIKNPQLLNFANLRRGPRMRYRP